MIFFNSKVAEFFLYANNFRGIMLFGFAFFKNRKEQIPQKWIMHEKTHIQQYWESIIIWLGLMMLTTVVLAAGFSITVPIGLFIGIVLCGYYVHYYTEWLIRFVIQLRKGYGFKKAWMRGYERVIFEQEAIDAENYRMTNFSKIFNAYNYWKRKSLFVQDENK